VAYDEALADRVRAALPSDAVIREQQMFGGLAFLVDGHMTCGLVGASLMLRLGRDAADAALNRPHVRPMDFTGKPLRTMVYVDPPGLRGAALRRWVAAAVEHTRTLPSKGPSAGRKGGRRAVVRSGENGPRVARRSAATQPPGRS
jgi:hypothetical protein